MKSIRLSLIVYFLLLLALALGAVSYFSYESTRQALIEKEASTIKLRQAQYPQEVDRVKAKFDDHVLAQARELEGRAFLSPHQIEVPVLLGLMHANLPATAHLQFSIWMPPPGHSSFKERQEYQFWRTRVVRPFDVRLFAHDEDDMPDEPLVKEGEYYQLSAFRVFGGPDARSFAWKPVITDRSPTLGERILPFDEELHRKADNFSGNFDDVVLADGLKLRRVTKRITVRSTRTSAVNAPLLRPKGKGGPKGPPAGLAPQAGWPGRTIYLHYATETTSRDAEIAALGQALQRDLSEMHETTRVALAGLRNRMLWIALGTFAAIVLGGLFLVYLGLYPLKRLTEAVRQVSARDFRLPIDPGKLPRELKPIAARMAETLEQLKRAFAREKQAAADISHELRTPLATLLTTIDVALNKPRTPDQYREVLEECRVSGHHMNQLVERLLKLARLDAGADYFRPREVDVTQLARQCADMVRPLAKARGINLRVHAEGPALLQADPDKVREVLNNLLHNAIEYNRPDGAIDLTVARDNGRLVLEVRDTGIGIPAEARERIFERFFRADPSRHAEGMHAGLGLAIVKGYVDLMGGTIGVDSGPNGSTFRIGLPAA